MGISDLPAVTATLNAIAAVFLLTGYVLPFPGEGAARVVYFTILVTHVTLAVTILPLALTTSAHGLRAHYNRHVRIARWTFPLWLYVSVTGVVTYPMLYQLYD